MLWLMENWKKALALLATLALACGSFWLGRSSIEQPATPAITQSDVKTKTDTEVATTTKKTTTTTKPDGTTVTVVDEQDQKSKTVAQTDSKTKADAQSKYRLTGAVALQPADLRAGKFSPQYEIGGGMRAFGPFWLDTHYNFTTHALALGAALEF